MVFDVEFIDDLHHIEPCINGPKTTPFSGHLQVVNVVHVVIRND